MEHLLSEGLTLLVFGMGFVFVFLTLLVVVTSSMSKLVMRFEPEPVPKPPKKPTTAPQASADDDELIAVMTAAIHKYRS